MNVVEVIELLKITPYQFYMMRAAGIIPPPSNGMGCRKKYSPAEVTVISKKIKAVNK